MKNIICLFSLMFISIYGMAQDAALTAEEKKSILENSPFNSVYPSSILKSSDAYFKAQMGLYKEGAIAEKEAHLVALGTSAAVKCQYCIPYHVSELKRLGASSAYEQVGENHQIHNTVVYPFGSATALLTLKHRSAHSALSLCGKRKNKNYKQKKYYFHLR